MFHSSLIRSEWPIIETGTQLSRRVARLLEAARLLHLRHEAAQLYAAARGPLAATGGRRRGITRGARHVPLQALKWHQQMRRLDNLMLAPQRSRAARLVWRITRAWARCDAAAANTRRRPAAT